jgi:hypothetical protein
MKRPRFNILSPKADNTMSGQKNPSKKLLARTVWLAPTLGVSAAAVLLILFSIADPSHGQTVSTITTDLETLNQALMSLLPSPLIDPTTDPPGNFTNVIPSQFDPGKTNLVQATWLSGIGCVTSGFIATPNASFTGVGGTAPYMDVACPGGDSNDKRNQGLLLVKTGPTNNFAAATAELINVKGITLTELGYDIRKGGLNIFTPNGSHCGAGAPRFDVVTADGNVHFLGCNSPQPVVTNVDIDWLRLRWDAAGLLAAFPPIMSTDVVSRIVIVFDEGTDTGPDFFGAAILDNIDVNGTFVGRGPVNAN